MTTKKETPILTLPGWDKYAKTRKLLQKIFEIEPRKKVAKKRNTKKRLPSPK